jgi:hypothetical protein
LRDDCQLNLTYKTTPTLVRYRLKAKVNVPRTSQSKKAQKKRTPTKRLLLTPEKVLCRQSPPIKQAASFVTMQAGSDGRPSSAAASLLQV